MPKKIKAEGKEYTVPDDATDEEINQIIGSSAAGSDLDYATKKPEAQRSFGARMFSPENIARSSAAPPDAPWYAPERAAAAAVRTTTAPISLLRGPTTLEEAQTMQSGGRHGYEGLVGNRIMQMVKHVAGGIGDPEAPPASTKIPPNTSGSSAIDPLYDLVMGAELGMAGDEIPNIRMPKGVSNYTPSGNIPRLLGREVTGRVPILNRFDALRKPTFGEYVDALRPDPQLALFRKTPKLGDSPITPPVQPNSTFFTKPPVEAQSAPWTAPRPAPYRLSGPQLTEPATATPKRIIGPERQLAAPATTTAPATAPRTAPVAPKASPPNATYLREDIRSRTQQPPTKTDLLGDVNRWRHEQAVNQEMNAQEGVGEDAIRAEMERPGGPWRGKETAVPRPMNIERPAASAPASISLGKAEPVEGFEGISDYPIMKDGQRIGSARIAQSGNEAYIGRVAPEGYRVGQPPMDLGSEGARALKTQFETEHPGVKLRLTPGSATAERTAARETRRSETPRPMKKSSDLIEGLKQMKKDKKKE